MDSNTALQIGQAYIVDNKPMVLTEINYRGKRDGEVPYFHFTDGRYGFGRVLGHRPWHADQLANLKVAEGVNPQDILDQLERSVLYMADFYRSKND